MFQKKKIWEVSSLCLAHLLCFVLLSEWCRRGMSGAWHGSVVALFSPFSFFLKHDSFRKSSSPPLTTHWHAHVLIGRHRHTCELSTFLMLLFTHFLAVSRNRDGPSCCLHAGLKENHRRQLIAWQAAASARQIEGEEEMKSLSRCAFAWVCV